MADAANRLDQSSPLGLLGVGLALIGLLAWPLLGDWRWAVTGVALLFPLSATGAALRHNSGVFAPMTASALAVGVLGWAWLGRWQVAVLGAALAVLLAVFGAAQEQRSKRAARAEMPDV